MDIAFKDDFLRRCANDHRFAQRKLGPLRAKKYLLHLQQMQAAVCLNDLRNVPQADFHELKADRKGQLACNLDHPYRLIFIAAHDPIPKKEDGGLDWNQVTAVTVLDIVDYHHG
jgi:proteic killer suppression protein